MTLCAACTISVYRQLQRHSHLILAGGGPMTVLLPLRPAPASLPAFSLLACPCMLLTAWVSATWLLSAPDTEAAASVVAVGSCPAGWVGLAGPAWACRGLARGGGAGARLDEGLGMELQARTIRLVVQVSLQLYLRQQIDKHCFHNTFLDLHS